GLRPSRMHSLLRRFYEIRRCARGPRSCGAMDRYLSNLGYEGRGCHNGKFLDGPWRRARSIADGGAIGVLGTRAAEPGQEPTMPRSIVLAFAIASTTLALGCGSSEPRPGVTQTTSARLEAERAQVARLARERDEAQRALALERAQVQQQASARAAFEDANR